MSRMEAIYWRLAEIDAAQQLLSREHASLHAEMVEKLGVKVGDVMELRDGSKAKILGAKAEFMALPEDDEATRLREVASVLCICAPATKDGFHQRHSVRHTVMDETVIAVELARLRGMFAQGQGRAGCRLAPTTELEAAVG